MNLYQVCFKYQDCEDDIPDRIHVLANSMGDVEAICHRQYPDRIIHEILHLSTRSKNQAIFIAIFQQ